MEQDSSNINTIKNAWIKFIHGMQDKLCDALEAEDGKGKFESDKWVRAGGGGGDTRIITNGNVFEKGGVNTSVVYGEVTDMMRQQLGIDAAEWWASGISLVLHPGNPMVPTIHLNYRMFELYNSDGSLADRWFGGGTDLTPYYLFEEDAINFHLQHKQACDLSDSEFYPAFKTTCDNYFVNTHRGNERRGIGGIFYDHKNETEGKNASFWMELAKNCAESFLLSYIPIVNKRKDFSFTPGQKTWQEIRRGRYVEFNLLHDRGTIFGLKTNGRTESILMSLPPTVRFEYDHHPEKNSEEEKLIKVLFQPKDWLNIDEKSDNEAWAKSVNTC